MEQINEKALMKCKKSELIEKILAYDKDMQGLTMKIEDINKRVNKIKEDNTRVYNERTEWMEKYEDLVKQNHQLAAAVIGMAVIAAALFATLIF